MFPLYPPEPFLDLAREQMGLEPRKRGANPDGFVSTAEVLDPDPVFMGLRRFVHTGPMGALLDKIDRWIEAREDRRHGQTIGDALAMGEQLPPAPDHSDTGRDERVAA